MGRIRVGVLFGGRSAEYDVSLESALSVWGAINRDRFEVTPIAITRSGRWAFGPEALTILAAAARGQPLASGSIVPAIQSITDLGRLDVILPVLHGPYGEDGTIQGLLEVLDVPYVASGVLGSALGMDKVAQKDLLAFYGLPVVDRAAVLRTEWESGRHAVLERLGAHPGLPCFVKPANMGSSVGISKASTPQDLAVALDLAARYDRRLLVEQAVSAREIECAVLGNDHPEASVPGEVVPGAEFYDYAAKYQEGRSRLVIPAEIAPEQTERIRSLALRAFTALDLAGMARVDFFLEESGGRIWINEVNTIPGFTSTSMFPKLWERTGVPYPEQIARLVELALERSAEKRRHTGR